MQAVRYIYGDFMRDLSDCLGHLEGQQTFRPNVHAYNVKITLHARLMDLRNNPVVLAALYMDPRYNSSEGIQFISAIEKEIAIVSKFI